MWLPGGVLGHGPGPGCPGLSEVGICWGVEKPPPRPPGRPSCARRLSQLGSGLSAQNTAAAGTFVSTEAPRPAVTVLKSHSVLELEEQREILNAKRKGEKNLSQRVDSART